jgi:hypothetical protein
MSASNPRTSGRFAVQNSATLEQRVRFSDFQFSRTQAGQCSAEVTLSFRGVNHVGRSTGPSSQLGELRVAAEACMRALEAFAPGAAGLELLGVKQVRAFDSNLTVVSVGLRESGNMLRLVGCYLATEDMNRGAAIAVLNATNRVMGPEVFRVDDGANE